MVHRPHIDLDERLTTWSERLTLFRAVRTIVLIAIILVLIAGALERLVEPKVFTSLGLSYWWAVTTVTTTGYGDIVPESVAGRIIGSALMLLGISLIPTLTSVVVATLVNKRQKLQQIQIDRQGKDHAEALARIEERLDSIDKGRSASS